ncbi:MAG: ferredoxin [Pseudomonadota bacterium]
MTGLAAALAAHGLAATGGFVPRPDDGLPEGTAMLCLVGADGPAMWRAFAASPEALDGVDNPLDRWSKRVLDGVAADLGATPFYPFGGPPYAPFLAWAARGEGAVASPLGMSVTPARGLHASWRGALALPEVDDALRTRLLYRQEPPCTGCHRPCTTACPVDAFAGGRYDVAACVAHVDGPEGEACRIGGCQARGACPVSLPLPQAQRVFHLDAFLRARRAAAAEAAGGTTQG